MELTVIDQIIVLFVGGVAVLGIKLLIEYIKEKLHKKRIYNWLYKATKQKDEKWRTTRAISSHNNLTEDRVRDICSAHDKIVSSTGKKEDLWGIKEFTRPNNDN